MSSFSKIWRFFKDTLNIELDRAFGLDISDRSVEIAEIRTFWRSRVVAYGYIELEVRKIRNLISLTKPRKVSTNKVVFSLPESTTFVHYFELQGKENISGLEEKILDKVSSVIPITPENSYYDWQVKALPVPQGGEPIMQVLYVAAEKETVEKYIALLGTLGLEPVIMDIESASLGRALLEQNGYPQMIVDIGAHTSTVSVFDRGGTLIVSISVPVAGEDFTNLIAKARGIQKAEAEELKKSAEKKEGEGAALFPIVEPAAAKIVAEIKRVIEYCETRRFLSVQKIILAGGSALLPGISDYFSNKLSLPVDVGDPLRRVKWPGKGDLSLPPVLFSNAIGLALRGASRSSTGINLLKRVPRSKFRLNAPIKVMYLGHSSKLTLIRSILNNSALTIPILIFLLLLLGIISYAYVYQPLNQLAMGRIIDVANFNYPAGEKIDVLPTSSEAKASVEELDATSLDGKQGTSTVEAVVESFIRIRPTPTGWLAVRDGPGKNFKKISQVLPGEKYTLLQTAKEWAKIKVSSTTEGWVSLVYIIVEKNN